MSTGYQIEDQGSVYFLTFQVVYWIDIFTRQSYRDIILESLKYCQKNKGLEIYGWVIMSNHVHLIVRSANYQLSDTIRDLKKFTSKEIIKEIQTGIESRRSWFLDLFSNAASKQNKNGYFQVWKRGNHAIVLYSEHFLKQRLNYIHKNPVNAGIVKNPIDYIYSSAIDYAGGKGLLEIIKI